jgi:hypothetical protein
LKKPCLYFFLLSAFSSLPPQQKPGMSKRGVLTRIHPLHAIGKGIIRNQIISSPPRVRDDRMSIPTPYQQHGRAYHRDKPRDHVVGCEVRAKDGEQETRSRYLIENREE